jgi:ABC-2 type transport system permease protein
MTGALFYLLVNSWKNRTWMRIRRLKQPKYLIGGIIGLLYFFGYVGRWMFHPGGFGRVGTGLGIFAENATLFESIGAMILFVIVVLAWVIPHERAALVFTEAEVAFLFPAPVSRRSLVHFKLIKSQVAILFTILFFTLIFGRFRAGGSIWMRVFGWWVILSTLNLHFIGSSFARTMLLDRGISNRLRRILVLMLVTAMLVGVGIWVKQTVPPPDANNFNDLSDIGYYFENALELGPLPYLLFPFRLVLKPYFAPDAVAFLLALWPALLLMAVQYVWVIRSNVAFEEASIEASKKMAEKIANMRANRGRGIVTPKKKKRAPFELDPMGLPSVALLWKNLIHAGHAFTPRFWLVMCVIGMVVAMALRGTRTGGDMMPVAGLVIPVVFVWSLLIGPQFLRQDFRQDLPMVDVLKTYPVKGWQMALGELMTPALILTCVHWFLIMLGAVFLYKFGGTTISLGLRISLACSLAVIVPGLNLISLVIPNAAVLLFPGWFQTGKDAPQGIEATGQRLIFALGQLFVFILALVPAIIAFAAAYWVLNLFVSYLLVLPAASLAAAVILGIEAGFGMILLGKLFERFDLSTEGNG